MATSTVSTRDFSETHPVLTLREFEAAVGPVAPSTVRNRLLKAGRSGLLDVVVPGVYASRVGYLRQQPPDPLLLASKLTPDAVISHHSALEAHGVAHSVFRRHTVLAYGRGRKVTYRDQEFVRLPAPAGLAHATHDAFTTQVRRDRSLVRVTSRERTLVDCLAQPKWSGGLEELLRSVGSFPSLNVEALLEYLDVLGSPSLVARTAWVLFSAPDLWRLTDEDRAEFRKRIVRGPFYSLE